MSCPVCHKPLNGANVCPRCGFKIISFSIGDPDVVRAMKEKDERTYRLAYLRDFDFGITCHYWKDQNGTYALETTERLSFGTGEELYENIVWLDREFSRLSDGEAVTVEVSVLHDGQEHSVRCQLPGSAEPLLQRLGLSVHNVPEQDQLALVLHLKNDKTKTTSGCTAFLAD